MIDIKLDRVGKRYNRDWIFKNWTAHLKPTSAYVIVGGNGSGKSTALRTLLGYAAPSTGRLTYALSGEAIKQSEAYRHFSFCSPYLELYEELTLDEMAQFHFSLKPTLPGIDVSHFAKAVHLESARNKPVKFFSSGMKQRLRLGLAIMSNVGAILLDEPLSNLDRSGMDWYKSMIDTYRGDRLIVVASNRQEEEYYFCDQIIEIESFKKA